MLGGGRRRRRQESREFELQFFVLKIFWRKKFLVGLDVGKTAT